MDLPACFDFFFLRRIPHRDRASEKRGPWSMGLLMQAPVCRPESAEKQACTKIKASLFIILEEGKIAGVMISMLQAAAQATQVCASQGKREKGKPALKSFS